MIRIPCQHLLNISLSYKRHTTADSRCCQFQIACRRHQRPVVVVDGVAQRVVVAVYLSAGLQQLHLVGESPFGEVADYSCQLNIEEGNPEKCVDDFIKFLPVLCYENGVMKVLSASDVLDMAMNNTSATLLARRWESALLVNVDNFTLQRLMNNKEAMAALMKIEGFRSLNYRHDTYQVPVIF